MLAELEYTCGVTEETMPGFRKRLTKVDDPYEAAKDAHAIVILTEWDAFATYDYERMYAGMKKPAFLFDGRNIIDLERMRSIGFDAVGIGQRVPAQVDMEQPAEPGVIQ